MSKKHLDFYQIFKTIVESGNNLYCPLGNIKNIMKTNIPDPISMTISLLVSLKILTFNENYWSLTIDTINRINAIKQEYFSEGKDETIREYMNHRFTELVEIDFESATTGEKHA